MLHRDRERSLRMYFVDRLKIEEALQFLEKQLALFEETEVWDSQIKLAALERITHTIMEVILDVGNAMIDGFIMRDPGSFEDIVDILEDEKVITESISNGIKSILPYRKVIIQSYTSIPHFELKSVFQVQIPILKQFSHKVREYLLTELGPVTAFKN